MSGILSRLCVTASLLLAGVSQSLAADAALVEAATKEGKVVWYTGYLAQQLARPMVAGFEAKYPGIKVEYSVANDTDTASKIITEAQANSLQADVFDGFATIFPLLDAGLIAKYSPESAKDFPVDLKDPNGFWTLANLYIMTAAYNTDLVKADEAPKSYDDLLDPKWKGKMVWTGSNLGPTGVPGFVYNMLELKGKEAGLEYLKRLANQDITQIDAYQRVVLDRVIGGEYAIALMINIHHVPISAAQGAPVAWIKMEPLLQVGSPIGVLKPAPHPNAGRLFVDYVLSDEGQNIMREAGYIPTRPGVPALRPEITPTDHFNVKNVSPEVARNHLAEWVALYRDTFRTN